jgi:hypothetical protein
VCARSTIETKTPTGINEEITTGAHASGFLREQNRETCTQERSPDARLLTAVERTMNTAKPADMNVSTASITISAQESS